MFNLDWFEQPFNHSFLFHQKFHLLSYDLKNVLTKQFPKIQKHPFVNIFQNRCSYKFPDIHQKISVLKPLFNTVRGLKSCNFNKRETPQQVLSCEYHQICKNSFFMEQLQWLLLNMVEEFLIFNLNYICTEEFIKERDLYRRSIIEDMKKCS